MSIEPMKKTVLLAPRGKIAAFLSWLYERSEFDIQKFSEYSEGEDLPLEPSTFEDELSRINDCIVKSDEVLYASNYFGDHQVAFIDSLFPLKTVVSGEKFQEIRKNFDLEKLAAKANRLKERMNTATRKAQMAQSRLSELEPLRKLGASPDKLNNLKGIRFRLMDATTMGFAKALEDAEARELLAIEKLNEAGGTVTMAVFWHQADEDKVDELVARLDFKDRALPSFESTPEQEIKRLQGRLESARGEVKEIEDEYRTFTPLYQDAVVIHGFYQGEKNRVVRAMETLSSRRVTMITGWIKKRDSEKFKKEVSDKFDGVEVIFSDPTREDQVPVALDNKTSRPAQLLVDMFGRPSYWAFDATKTLFLPFIVFFGICFGDVVYGFMLIGIMLWLKNRYKDQKFMYPFFHLFMWGGCATIVFGALTGSWASDLFVNESYASFLGPLKFMKGVVESCAVINPMSKPMVALAIALLLGVLNQFWGIGLAFYQSAKDGKWLAALVDSVAWIVFLTGLILLPMFSELAKILLLIGGIMLVLFQGRDIKNWIGRLLGGLVSLYGILGSYGVTSFVGDVLSYSRLLALGLTTMIAGMAFNIVADLVGDLGGGAILFWLIVIGGHVFNFLMCVLGSFVHSARLIFLEFFSRFYEGGARPFKPYGFENDKVEILKAS